MFIRRLHQRRQGAVYTYYSLVETVRTNGRVRQRTICYLGRLDNLRPPDWLRVAERLPDPAWLPLLQQEVGYTPPTPPAGPVRNVTIDPESIAWAHPRRLGDVYIAWRTWQLLELDQVFEGLLGNFRTGVPLPAVAALIACNRLIEPRSERGIFQWWPKTALPELLAVPRLRLHLNLLYRCLTEAAPHQLALQQHLVRKGRELFAFANDLVLYDLTSTYFEGRMAGNPKALRGYSRDHRPDCKQLCIGLVVNRDGFPLGFDTLAGNIRDAQTLTPLITALEDRCGGLQRIVCFDRGMATEANLRHWRQTQRQYLCAVRRAVTRTHLPTIRQGPWQRLRERGPHEPCIEVLELPAQQADGRRERWLLCRSAGCQLKERQIFETRLSKARAKLAQLQAQVTAGTFTTNAVIVAKAKRAVGRTHDLSGIFSFALRRGAAGKELVVQESAPALQDHRDLQGVYLLRTTVAELPPQELWHTYMLLTRVEAAFRNLKSDLCLRPIFHSKPTNADAHVLFAVLAYAMSITIQLRHRRAGGEQTTAALLEELRSVQLAELSFRTEAGDQLCFERASIPSARQQELLDSLGWRIPERYLPPDLGTEPARL